MTSPEVVRVALEQLDVTPGDVPGNRDLAVSRARSAFESGGQVVALPELAISGYVTEPSLALRSSEPLDGPSLAALGSVASRFSGLIVYGFCERQGVELYNSVVALGPEGPVLHYRKLHLFDAEKETYTPGDLGLPVAETPFGTIGVCICYDLRFVEVLRVLALQGADIVIAPAAWVTGFDRVASATGSTQHVDNVRVQANLNQVAVVAVSQVAGAARGAAATLGGSAAFDASGQPLAGPLSRHTQDSAVAEIDLLAVRASRVRGPRIRPREDRRRDLYSITYAGRSW